jgi:hypothetical protein
MPRKKPESEKLFINQLGDLPVSGMGFTNLSNNQEIAASPPKIKM